MTNEKELLENNEENTNDMVVKFFLKEKEIDLDKINRVSRRILIGISNRYKKKYANIIGPNGERPNVVIKVQSLGSVKAEVSLQYPESMSSVVPNHNKATRIE